MRPLRARAVLCLAALIGLASPALAASPFSRLDASTTRLLATTSGLSGLAASPGSGATLLAVDEQELAAFRAARGGRLSVPDAQGATFLLGGSTIKVHEAEVQEESTRFDLKGPTAVLRAIKAVKMTRLGKPVESRFTSRSWSDKESELGFEAQAKGGTVAFEVELWQNVQNVKVPMRVSASVSAPVR